MSDPIAPLATLLADASFLSWLPTIAMIGGILTLGTVMMVFFNRRERQLKSIAAQIGNDLEEARALRHQLDEAHTLASNMMVTAQRLSARLDERVAALDMASLRMNATRNALPRTAPATPASARSRVREASANVSSTARENDLALSPVLTSIATAMAPPPAQAVRSTVEFKPAMDPLTQQIYELADAGHTAVAIARDLNEQVGKIELILALRSR